MGDAVTNARGASSAGCRVDQTRPASSFTAFIFVQLEDGAVARSHLRAVTSRDCSARRWLSAFGRHAGRLRCSTPQPVTDQMRRCVKYPSSRRRRRTSCRAGESVARRGFYKLWRRWTHFAHDSVAQITLETQRAEVAGMRAQKDRPRDVNQFMTRYRPAEAAESIPGGGSTHPACRTFPPLVETPIDHPARRR